MRLKDPSHGNLGSRTESESELHEEKQLPLSTWIIERALDTSQLMEYVCERANLNHAYRRVKANGGAPGIDGMNIKELGTWLRDHGSELKERMLDGTFEPTDVRGVQIPKASGGMRQLGIPTVIDRFVQQAILQVISPLFERDFSESSYGFRPKKSAHQALLSASKYVREEEKTIVVDIDLEKFFDQVNHDILMNRVSRKIADKRMLQIMRRFLQSGIMQNGVVLERKEGTPQGGPLSPLLANILLDDLDKELDKRGHKFCRYADDCNIYVSSLEAGTRVMESVTQFIERKLKLKINREKSAVANVWERRFLGHTITANGNLTIAIASLKRVKDQIKQITTRNRGQSFEKVIEELNQKLPGWVAYYRHAKMVSVLRILDQWLRRRLRCYRIKQRKSVYSIINFICQQGVPRKRARSARREKGWWKLSNHIAVVEAMPNRWFKEIGLICLEEYWRGLKS